MSTIDPPANLLPDGPGRALWSSVLADFILNPAEQLILELAASQADDLCRVTEELSRGDVLSLGSGGQLRCHPLLPEARAGRIALSRLLGQLGLEDADETQRSKSAAGRRMALIRHHGGGHAS